MYKIFSRYVKSPEMSSPESPFAAVKECGGTVYGFWVRPVNFCLNVSPLMEEAIERAFSGAPSPDADEMINRVFCEWTKAVIAYHDKESKPFSPDIFKKYQFEMQVIVAPQCGGITLKSYNMDGAFDLRGKMRESATGKDAVSISLARANGFTGECAPEYAGVLAFNDGNNRENRYVYDFTGAMLAAASEAEGESDPVGEKFGGSYLLAVDMDKYAAFRRRKEETRPYITLKTLDARLAFYAEKGKIKYSEMELLEGFAPRTEEYFEVTEAAEEYIAFIAEGKYFEDGEKREIKLAKGEAKTFKQTESREVSLSDGDFDFSYVSSLTVNWEK